jgi:hypothetical protein
MEYVTLKLPQDINLTLTLQEMEQMEYLTLSLMKRPQDII